MLNFAAKLSENMANNMAKDGDQRLESFESTLSQTELFIEEHRKPIIIVVCVIAAIVLGIIAVNKFYFEPRNAEAQTAMFRAEEYFGNGDFEKALNGDGNNVGFLEVMDQYGWTESGNLACYYAGMCYLNTGDFENAIKYLKKYDGNDNISAPFAYGGIADANVELGNNSEAVKYYMKAAKASKNQLTAPQYLLRAGMTYELLGEFENAVKTYEKIKSDYPMATEGSEIDKYILRAKTQVR